MSNDSTRPKISHGFRLDVSKGGGKPGIFLKPFFPDEIVSFEPCPDGGTVVTFKLPDGSRDTITIVQSAGEIEALVQRCRELDATMDRV